MIWIFNKETEEKGKTVEYKYELTEYARDVIAREIWNYIDTCGVGRFASLYENDNAAYLRGVADTMKNPARIREIANIIDGISDLFAQGLVERKEIKNDA